MPITEKQVRDAIAKGLPDRAQVSDITEILPNRLWLAKWYTLHTYYAVITIKFNYRTGWLIDVPDDQTKWERLLTQNKKPPSKNTKK